MYGWSPDITLNLTLDEIFLIRKAADDRDKVAKNSVKSKQPKSKVNFSTPQEKINSFNNTLDKLGVIDL